MAYTTDAGLARAAAEELGGHPWLDRPTANDQGGYDLALNHRAGASTGRVLRLAFHDSSLQVAVFEPNGVMILDATLRGVRDPNAVIAVASAMMNAARRR